MHSFFKCCMHIKSCSLHDFVKWAHIMIFILEQRRVEHREVLRAMKMLLLKGKVTANSYGTSCK